MWHFRAVNRQKQQGGDRKGEVAERQVHFDWLTVPEKLLGKEPGLPICSAVLQQSVQDAACLAIGSRISTALSPQTMLNSPIYFKGDNAGWRGKGTRQGLCTCLVDWQRGNCLKLESACLSDITGKKYTHRDDQVGIHLYLPLLKSSMISTRHCQDDLQQFYRLIFDVLLKVMSVFK